MRFLILLAAMVSLSAFAQPRETRQPEADRSSTEKAKEKAKQASEEAKRATKNAALTGKVKSALASDVGLKTVKIDVDSDDGGVVTLKGRVDSEDTKRRAEATAKKVKGVTTVRNELRPRAKE
jgi:hyperosmotically inducible protein